MKYQVGDVVLIKDINFYFCLYLRPRVRSRPGPRSHLKNTLGIITEVEKYNELFEKSSTENDNGYIWFAQVDGKEYYFYEDEVDCEVIS